LGFGFKAKPILTKSWILSENSSDWILDYCFLHNFQHVCAFVLTESSLCWVPCLWVSFWFFGVLRCSLFFLCLICFVQVFLSFCVFGKFNLFIGFGFVFGLFSGQTRIFGSVYSQTNDFGSTQSGQLGWVKKKWAKGFIPYLVCHFFLLRVYRLKGFDKYPLDLVWLVLLQNKMGFYQTKPKNIIINI